MPQNHHLRQKLRIFFGVVLLILSITLFLKEEKALASVYFFMASQILAFLFIIELKEERVMKGVFLIGIGLTFGKFFPNWLYSDLISIKEPLLNLTGDELDAYQYITIFKEGMIYACCGAGGSLIAIHSDRSATDREEKVVHQTIIDKTKQVEELSEKVESLSETVKYLKNKLVGLIIVSLIGYIVLIFTVINN